MYKEDNYFDYLSNIYYCTKVKDAVKYLNTIKINFNKIEKKQQKEYLKRLNEIGICHMFDTFFEIPGKYKIYQNSKAIRKIIFEQFIYLNKKNFNIMIDNLLNFFDSITEKHDTKIILKKDIDFIFKIINEKMPDFNKILADIKLDILIFNNIDKYSNSVSITSADFKHFNIVCFYMKNEDEYKQGLANPIYVFLHELGHIICWIMTKEVRTVPKSFFQDMGKYLNNLSPNNPDALEVFADSFAMAIMYKTSLDCYNPFKEFPEELFIDLEKYFANSIKELC